MAPLTAYVYRQAIFRPGYCFTKRQPERTSYTTDRHHQRGPANFPSRCVFLSLSLSLSRILRALHTDPRASSWDLRRVGHRHPLVERIEWIERISLRHFDEILLFLSAQFIFLRGSIDDDIVVACSEKFKCVSGRRKIGRIIKIT